MARNEIWAVAADAEALGDFAARSCRVELVVGNEFNAGIVFVGGGVEGQVRGGFFAGANGDFLRLGFKAFGLRR